VLCVDLVGSSPVWWIVWMIKRMIKGHPTQDRMPRQAALDPPPRLLGLDPVHYWLGSGVTARI
jgi:hypothetical protein